MHSLRKALVLVCLLIACGRVIAQLSKGETETELLRDPRFLRGVTQGYANHLTPVERADCQRNWESKGITDAQWLFWEISESLYFAHNKATPDVPRRGTYIWSTTDKTKQCRIDNGAVRLILDTSKEWREGGRLDRPDREGRAPRYGNALTNWPHFLLGQHLTGSNDPLAPIPDQGKQLLSKYRRLRLTASIRLNRLQKSGSWDHHEEFGAANHAIFYVGFVLVPRSAAHLSELGKFYALAPAIYSEGDGRHVPGSLPWLGIDQFGDTVYFSGAQPTLRVGAWVDYDIDVKQLIREGLAAASQKSLRSGLAKQYILEDYFLAIVLIGWEIWGGFETDVEFQKLSLRGVP